MPTPEPVPVTKQPAGLGNAADKGRDPSANLTPTPWTDAVTFLAVPELANGEKEECVSAADARTLERELTQLRSDLALANQKLALGNIADKGGVPSESDDGPSKEAMAAATEIFELNLANEYCTEEHRRFIPHDAAQIDNAFATLRAQLESANQRSAKLADCLAVTRKAYVPDGHSAPHDCFATGPLTGDPIKDFILCPGCAAEAAFRALTAGEGEKKAE